MSQTVLEIGRVPVNRGDYSSTEKYYKDNIVQYGSGSYIASPSTSSGYVQGVAPYSSDPLTPNTGWKVFSVPHSISEMTSEEVVTGVGSTAKTISPSGLDMARRGKEKKISGSSVTMTLTPGVHLVFGTMASLAFNSCESVVLANSDVVQTNAYSFEFDSGSTATTLSLPSDIIFSDELSIEANTHYEVNIKYNPKTNKYYGLIASWPNE